MNIRDKTTEGEKDILWVGGSESEVEDTEGLIQDKCHLMMGHTIPGFDWTQHLLLCCLTKCDS